MFSRRSLLRCGVPAALVVAACSADAAFKIQKVAKQGRHAAALGETFRASQTFVSTSGGPQTNPPHQWVHKFQKGQIASGNKVQLKVNGSDIVTQYRACTKYNDGSLNVVVFYVYPGTVGAGATFTYDMYEKAGAYIDSSSRSISDITAHDFKTVLTDLKDDTGSAVGSGTFNCSANTNLAVAGRTTVLTDGANALEVVTWGKATDNTGGAEDAFLTEKSRYVVWNTPGGSGVYAISHNSRIQSGWRNVSSPHAHTFKAQRKDSSTVLLDFGVAHSFLSGDVDTTNETIANTGIQTGQCVFFTSGTVGGLSANTPYWARRDGTGKVTLYNAANSAWNGGSGNRVDLTSAGAGTLTVYFDLYYHTAKDVLDTDARPEWTAHEPLIEIAWTDAEVQYLQKAGAWWNFDLSATPSALTSCDFYPGSLCSPAGATSGNIRPGIDDTGEHDMLYNLGVAASTAIITRNATDLRVARVLGYCGSHIAQSVWLDETDNGSGDEVYTPLTLSNGSDGSGTAFTGMGTPLNSSDTKVSTWPGLGSGASASTLRFGPTVFVTADHSHYPQTAYIGFWLTGDPLLVDTLYMASNEHWNTNASGGNRTFSYNGTAYKNIHIHWVQPRSSAYTLRDNYFAAICAPDGSGLSAYYSKTLNDNLAYIVAIRAHEDSSFSDNGMWVPYDGMWGVGSHLSAANWLSMQGFAASIIAHAAQLVAQGWGTTNATTVGTHFSLFEKLRCAAGSLMGKGPYWANAFVIAFKDSRSATTWRAPARWGVQNADNTITWGASNTLTNGSAIAPWANDDRIWFTYNPAVTNDPPSEIQGAIGTDFWIKSKSGSTHKISTMQGGADFAYTQQATPSSGFMTMQDYSATGFSNVGAANLTALKMTGSIAQGAAMGLSGYDTIYADLAGRLGDMGAGWEVNSDPRFAFSATVM